MPRISISHKVAKIALKDCGNDEEQARRLYEHWAEFALQLLRGRNKVETIRRAIPYKKKVFAIIRDPDIDTILIMTNEEAGGLCITSIGYTFIYPGEEKDG